MIYTCKLTTTYASAHMLAWGNIYLLCMHLRVLSPFQKKLKTQQTKSQVPVWQVLPNSVGMTSGQNVCTQHLYYNWCAHHDAQELVHYIKDLLYPSSHYPTSFQCQRTSLVGKKVLVYHYHRWFSIHKVRTEVYSMCICQ